LQCKVLWQVKDINDKIDKSERHHTAFLSEISMKGGQRVTDAVKRVKDWIMTPKVGQQINYLGSKFTHSDVAEKVHLTDRRGSTVRAEVPPEPEG